MFRSIVVFLAVWCGAIGTAQTALRAATDDPFEQHIRPILRDYCITCHSTEKQEGELDLQRFETLSTVHEHAEVWEHVQEQLHLGEMPPKDARQLPPEQRQQLVAWVQSTLRHIALATAGDPGPVVLRRLSNQEYTYTLRDLTGIASLSPAREFPVDGAAGEGFTNAGAALVMSPALLQKYLDAAKEVAEHMVLLPDGIRFSSSRSQQDWTDEALAAIRRFYAHHTAHRSGDAVVKQGIELDSGTGEGGLPVARYLQAVQGRSDATGLSPKYLRLLRSALEATHPSPLLEPLREKYHKKQLVAADIEAWQKPLWRFNTIGHIGRADGPKTWQEPASPLVPQQEFRHQLQPEQDCQLYLICGTAGDGAEEDKVVWENPRLVGENGWELPIHAIPEFTRHIEATRARILATTELCLTALAHEGSPSREHVDVDPELLDLWRNYLGIGAAKPDDLLPNKIEGVAGYAFVQGWTAGEDLSVFANASDTLVEIPGKLPAHSVAAHPSPNRAVVVAWRSPVAGKLQIRGHVADAHLGCGNGVAWTLDVVRGSVKERLAAGTTESAEPTPLGPWDQVQIEPDQLVMLTIDPGDGDHGCDLTSLNLTLTDGQTTWDLAHDVSPNILSGNPHGPWHFLSQPATKGITSALPAPLVAWRAAPSAELATKVREHLEKDFPLTHPLLMLAQRSFRPQASSTPLMATAPSVLEVQIPAALSQAKEFVVTGRLAASAAGSVQLHVDTRSPEAPITTLRPDLPIVVGDAGPARRRMEVALDEFRALFPISLCYSRIVPVDEAVTLILYYREDDKLRELILDADEARELDRLWSELNFVADAPLKLVNAFNQISEFATQDRPDLVKSFGPLRAPIMKAAEDFQDQKNRSQVAQSQAVIDLAHRAWRRPLTELEMESLRSFPPRLMLVRVLMSPAFLYRGESAPQQSGPVDDWELATRLSYFLWSSLPDDELREVAAAGNLRDPEVRAQQTRRMLKDERIRRLATEFGCQWLHVRDVATLNEKSERHFPTFAAIQGDMQEEVTRFFIDMFQNDRSVLALLDADYSFVSRRLAEHYGIEFDGTDWQRVEGLRSHGRGGVLGFAATLAKHSGASRSSAILRGTWLSETLLGDKIPNPPPGVPTLPEETPDGLSERQLIERHSSDEKCAGCHRRIDPYGFALEGFDAIGHAREADTRTVLFDGTQVEGLADLRDYLSTTRRKDFLQQFSRKLLGYALGRSVQLSDQPLLDSMVQTDGQRIGELFELLVRSPQFCNLRGQDSAAQR